MKRTLILSLAVMFAAMQLSAKVTLSPLFTDNMVLQQKTEAKIWGTAAPKRLVTVNTSWNGAFYTTTAAADGTWSVTVDTPSAGGPYTLTFSDGKEKTVLNNVLIGEVWICSGQSNMEMKMADKVIGWEKDLEESPRYSNIRLLHVNKAISPVPQNEVDIVGGGWKTCNAENLNDFSATAYYFGKHLNENLDIPIGLIETCWGGTVAEAWTSEGSLRMMGDFDYELDMISQLPVTEEGRNAVFLGELAKWEEKFIEIDPGFQDGKPVWSMSSFDDSSWQTCRFPDFLQFQGFPSTVGYFWVRKTITVPDEWNGCELKLTIGAVDDNDFTYFEGVKVGHTEGSVARSEYTVPASAVKAGQATVAVRVMDTGGLGGILGGENDLAVEGPDGNVISLAGEWKFKMLMGLDEAPSFPVNTAKEANFPTFLYNAMIHPLVELPIAGAIWYQGESNVSRAAQYKDLLPLMINDWRQQWGYDFPFYLAQIANYMTRQTGPEESQWAELREAQLQTLNLENTGMAVLIDIGEEMDIHPKNKVDVGKRLALNALAKTYGVNVAYSGPMYDGYTIEGDAIRVSFTHTDGGLVAKGGEALEGFYVAGADHKFHKAEAVIEGNTVIVRSAEVAFPVAVRYAWADNPVCNLYNGAELPASPFRTDCW